MKARGILIGCGVGAFVIVILSLVAIVVTWRHMTASIPTQQPVALVDAQTRGFAAVRLTPGDPIIAEILARHADLKDADPNEFLPASILWLSHGPGPDVGHTVVLSLEPRGRMLGLIADFSLWKAGRAGGERVSRDEYGGEGITSFPGTGLAGHVFVRGNSIIWSSDLAAAHHTVDLMNGDLVAGESIARFLPEPGSHMLDGVIARRDGALGEALTFLPGTALDLSEEETAGIAAISLAIDAQPGDAAGGVVQVHFEEDVPVERRAAVTATLASRISQVAIGGMTFQTAPRQEPERGLIAITATGVSSTAKEIETWFGEALRWLQRLESEGV